MQITSRKFLVSLCVLILGLFYVAFFSKHAPSSRSSFGNISPQALNALVTEILPDAPVYVLNGIIIDARSGKLIMDVPELYGVQIPGSVDLRRREVLLEAETRIVARRVKDPATLNAELRRFSEQGGALPEPYAVTVISENELKAGDSIAVQAMGGVDIKNALTIEAATITKTAP